MSVEATKETLGFQAEVEQLLRLVVHSLYSNKEIFLRELISNASDACDKLRFEALSDPALYEGDTEFKIRLSIDKAARTVTVSDNGIGMSRAEVIENIGTIAHSGTRAFLDKLTGDAAKDAHLIGQFGVGFYSSFMVADRVTLITRRAGLAPEHGVRWESTGEGTFTLENVEKPTHGTDVILHLREGEDEFLEPWRLEAIVRKYSDHITLPIVMPKEQGEGEETVNQASALWARPKNEITKEQYEAFYRHVAHDYEAPLSWVHSRVEGKQEYTLLLYVPAHAPWDLWDRQQRHGVKLYVRRVFIMEDMERLMPHYLRFVRGVIDSNDLPLNVSREILQHSRDVDTLRAGATRKVLDMLEDLASSRPEDYARFWKEFGRVFKEGIGEDAANRERIARLLRFASTHAAGDAQDVSLTDYVARMKPGQKAIYYVTGESAAACRSSPHLEIFRKKDVEVLLLSDRVDEWMLGYLHEFEGKPLKSVAKGEPELGELLSSEEKQLLAEDEEKHRDLLGRMRKALAERVRDVRVSRRLTDSAACLVVGEHELSMNLKRLLEAAGREVPRIQPVLEVNVRHPIVARLVEETDEARFAEWSRFLYDQALLAEGGSLEDPAGFVSRLNGLMLALAGQGGQAST